MALINNEISRVNTLRGEIFTPGDKSISHRALMFGSISKGSLRITNFLDSADCNSTMDCFRKMGADIKREDLDVIVSGKGLYGLKKPDTSLYVGNSGTTMRLMSGILAGQGFETVVDGDESIRKRPMARIIEPLKLMGADISSNGGGLCPLIIKPSDLRGIDYTLPVASAQVKSCVLLAGLYADGSTRVTENVPSRDHTERMLKAFGADINRNGNDIILNPGADLYAIDVRVPGDISSAAYFIAAGLIHPDASLLIKNVNLNPTRAGMIEVVKKMGGRLKILDERLEGGEEVGDLLVESSNLKGTTIEGDIIPTLIDELPIIAIMAAFAQGETIIKDASELRKKESDRIESVTSNLKSMGADITPTEDGMIINGGKELHGGDIKTYMDHRIAMSFAVAGLVTGDIRLDHPECVNISFSNFYGILSEISR